MPQVQWFPGHMSKTLKELKEEVKKQQLFGPGRPHVQFEGMLGNYLAVAVDDVSIFSTQEEKERTKSYLYSKTK